METRNRPEATIFVIFGAGGDLTWRKLIPALYNLYLDSWMPDDFMVFGIDRFDMSNSKFRDHLRKGVDRFSRQGKSEAKQWKKFAESLSFIKADLTNDKIYGELSKKLSSQEKEWDTHGNRIFYMAVPPTMIETITKGLAKAKLNQNRKRSRLVIEKPFGTDLESAKALNRLLTAEFRESQLFRIDHYLGKETVQNILAFRFGNSIFEPIWNRQHIDHVQITVAEQVGIGHRGEYYEQAGALRDMVQNHLLQILCLIAMEPPVSFDDNEIRNKKVDVLHAIREILPEQVHHMAARGQYGGGWIEGEHVPGYRSESGVSENSGTETYAAIKFYIDNWRWKGVPFYLRTGKRLPVKTSEVVIQFEPVPHQTLAAATLRDWRPNRLLIAIQPEEGILLRFEVKHPGPSMHLSPVMMRFFYREAFKATPPEAYETLLLDVMWGDATLFMRADQKEAAWSVITPVLDVWETVKSTDFPNYTAGSWGPEEADILIARDGNTWVVPTLLQCQEDTAVCRVTMELEK
jgi:glucose-6-phosphate 1-dehydrogenase